MKKSVERKRKKRRKRLEAQIELTMEERQKIRKAKRRKRKIRALVFLLTLLILSGLGYGIYYVCDQGMLDITKITVSGNKHYKAEEVVHTAAIPLGVNTFAISASDAKKKLLKDPYVKEAKVSRKLPDEIKITVAERKARCAISFSGYYILLDEEGIALEKVKEVPELMIIEGFAPVNLKLGKKFTVKEQTDFNTVMKIISSMKENEIDFKKISFANGIVKANIYDKLACKTTPENLMANMAYLKQILDILNMQGVQRGVINIGNNRSFTFSPEIE